MMLVFMYCPFLIGPSVFSNVYYWSLGILYRLLVYNIFRRTPFLQFSYLVTIFSQMFANSDVHHLFCLKAMKYNLINQFGTPFFNQSSTVGGSAAV